MVLELVIAPYDRSKPTDIVSVGLERLCWQCIFQQKYISINVGLLIDNQINKKLAVPLLMCIEFAVRIYLG